MTHFELLVAIAIMLGTFAACAAMLIASFLQKRHHRDR